MDMKPADRLLYAIVAVLAVMLVAYLALARSSGTGSGLLGSGKPFSLEASPESQQNAAAPTPSASDTTTPTTAPKALTYEAAVELYGGYRFQFLNCHGTPGTMTLKVGSKFLLDNRDAKPRTIAVGKTVYKLGANGFAVATASMVAGTYNITCDGGGAATLKVQK